MKLDKYDYNRALAYFKAASICPTFEQFRAYLEANGFEFSFEEYSKDYDQLVEDTKCPIPEDNPNLVKASSLREHIGYLVESKQSPDNVESRVASMLAQDINVYGESGEDSSLDSFEASTYTKAILGPYWKEDVRSSLKSLVQEFNGHLVYGPDYCNSVFEVKKLDSLVILNPIHNAIGLNIEELPLSEYQALTNQKVDDYIQTRAGSIKHGNLGYYPVDNNFYLCQACDLLNSMQNIQFEPSEVVDLVILSSEKPSPDLVAQSIMDTEIASQISSKLTYADDETTLASKLSDFNLSVEQRLSLGSALRHAGQELLSTVTK